MAAPYRCGTARRRAAVRDAATVNGIEYLEVSADQQTLEVLFLHDLPGGGGQAPVPSSPVLTAEHVAIDGGVRITGIEVESVSAADDRLTVTVSAPGDFSTYTLRLRSSEIDDAVPGGFDPQLASVAFSFKAGCENPFDCKTVQRCPPEPTDEPELDYLAKDYGSFRRLMLDRMAALAPEWRERNPADSHVALVELLAYTGDALSYHQDAVATEAYLGAARRRISLRRHARLLDYRMHAGCNARAWVVLATGDAEGATIDAHPDDPAQRVVLLTRGEVETGNPNVPAEAIDEILAVERPVVFEPLSDLTLRASHDKISFYLWSDAECCLPAGSTRATLVDNAASPLQLDVGDVLLLEEVLGATTGQESDADPGHRHAVRLTSVAKTVDPLDGTAVVEVAWSSSDALPFPLCLSRFDEDGKLQETAVARGNVLLVDHGLTLEPEQLGPVAADRLYRPRLARRSLTFAALYDADVPAAAATHVDVHDGLPSLLLVDGENERWTPVFDLLGSDRFAPEVVVEVEADGAAQLRFGDGDRGRRPEPGATFTATYRVGGGRAGNVGAGAITRIAAPFEVGSVGNPLPAHGGVDPEGMERVRLDAPEAFRSRQCAVTEADYAEITERHEDVQRAAAAFRWTGSWYTTFVTVDRLGGGALEPAFERDIAHFLDRYRMAGHDVELEPPVTVPLDLALEVCVEPHVFRSDVEQELLERLSSRTLPDGGRGYFHPDNFTFAKPLYLSQVYAAALEVEGVRWVRATRFQRWGEEAAGELEAEAVKPARAEILRLDNDPNFAENGRLELVLKGGM